MLLNDVKNHLRITWDDEDSEIQQLISRSQNVLNGLIGVDLDFEVEGLPKSLLLDYCRYARNNALEFFEENFKKEILRLQLKEASRVYKESLESEESV